MIECREVIGLDYRGRISRAGGMVMPGRKYSAGTSYRYGFNGKEKDKDIASEDYDFGARVLDTRLGGRWFSCDPLQAKHAGESPYLFVGANPILYIDPNGKDRIVSLYALTVTGERVLISRTTHKEPYEITYGINKAIHWGNDGHYYKADIEQTLILDMASGKIIDHYSKEGVAKPISMADYYYGPEEKVAQSTGKGSYQDYGYSVTGNSNGENIDLIDKAGETLGSMDVGGLLDVLSVAGADPKAFFESFDKSALENVLTGLEKIKATKELREVIKIVKDNVGEQLKTKNESPSSVNTKAGTTQTVKSSAQSNTNKGTTVKSTIPDSITIHERTMNGKTVNPDSPYNNETLKTIVNPVKKKHN